MKYLLLLFLFVLVLKSQVGYIEMTTEYGFPSNEVFIFDIMGRAVYPVISTLSNSSYSVIINDLLEGVYLIRVKNGENHKTVKVVIEH